MSISVLVKVIFSSVMVVLVVVGVVIDNQDREKIDSTDKREAQLPAMKSYVRLHSKDAWVFEVTYANRSHALESASSLPALLSAHLNRIDMLHIASVGIIAVMLLTGVMVINLVVILVIQRLSSIAQSKNGWCPSS